MLTEALNEEGKTGEVLPYITQVCTRAFGGSSAPAIAADHSGLRSAVMYERRVELVFENKRWTDLVSTG